MEAYTSETMRRLVDMNVSSVSGIAPASEFSTGTMP